MGREARGFLSSDFAQLRHFDGDQGGDGRSNAGPRGQNAAVEFGFDRPASVFEPRDHLPAGVEDQRIESLLEACLLDRNRSGQLPSPCRQRLETRLSGVPERSQLPGHNVSKARNQTRVQPVGLGDEAFSLAKA